MNETQHLDNTILYVRKKMIGYIWAWGFWMKYDALWRWGAMKATKFDVSIDTT